MKGLYSTMLGTMGAMTDVFFLNQLCGLVLGLEEKTGRING